MATIEDKVFDRLFKEAEIATFTPEELREYEDSLKPTATSRTLLTRRVGKDVQKGLQRGKRILHEK